MKDNSISAAISESHHFFPEKENGLFFLVANSLVSGYFRKSCLGRSLSGLGLLKELSSPEKLRHWDSQERSALSNHSPLPRLTVPLHCPHLVAVVLSRLGLSGQHSKIYIFLRSPSFAWASLVSLPQFPKVVFGFILCSVVPGLCKSWMYMAVWQGVCIASPCTVIFYGGN